MQLRKDLPELPRRMRGLPLDERGYPVPWFVEWYDGKPDFRVVSGNAIPEALRFERCWICGQKRGRFGAFVIGPMCVVNRVSSEPPSHRDCAEFAVKACPFLVRPGAKRRDANMPRGRQEAPGNMLLHNPGVSVLWITDRWQPVRADGGILFDIGNPTELSWWREGRPATNPEILDSIETGFPALMEVAEKEGPESVKAIVRAKASALDLLPAA